MGYFSDSMNYYECDADCADILNQALELLEAELCPDEYAEDYEETRDNIIEALMGAVCENSTVASLVGKLGPQLGTWKFSKRYEGAEALEFSAAAGRDWVYDSEEIGVFYDRRPWGVISLEEASDIAATNPSRLWTYGPL